MTIMLLRLLCMNKRKIYIVLCILSVSLGGGIYIIFRPNTYVSEIFVSIFPLPQNTIDFFSYFNCNFVKYYFPDYLWAFSLVCGFNTIFSSHKKIFHCAIAVLLMGILCEILQLSGIVTGTGDLIDVLMYLTAVCSVVLIEKIFLKGVKK